MPASIGVNLRVTGHCRQGGRKYMEDFFSVAYQQTQDEKDLEYAFFGIFDGHGGMEAATFAKEHLMESIVRQKNFWSDKDDDVLKAIKEGYINTHYAMWREQEKWPKTASGLPSTAGTTASVAFIRRGKIYIGHVGDSGIILGYQEPENQIWQARPLTEDHKPENKSEMTRIEQCGGKVVTKSGVPRVVWNRPRIGHKGPVRRSTPIDEIPFLAVARSLGDLWSYNSALDEFVVSPDPDTVCIPIDTESFRCLIFGTDGLWNMISATSAVSIVQVAEQHNERTVLAAADSQETRASKVWINPSKCLVERALERWSNTRMRADNTSVITLMLDPPGPPRAEVIKNQRLLENRQRQQQLIQQTQEAINSIENDTEEQFQTSPPDYPETGLEILTMYEDQQITNNYSDNPDFQPVDDTPVETTKTTSTNQSESCSSGLQQNLIGPLNNVQNDELQDPNEDTVETNNSNLNKDKVVKQPEHITSRRLTEENLNKVHQQVLNDMQSYETDEENQNTDPVLQSSESTTNTFEASCSNLTISSDNCTKLHQTKSTYSNNQIETSKCTTTIINTRLKQSNTQKNDQKYSQESLQSDKKEKQPDIKDKTQKESKKLQQKASSKCQEEVMTSSEVEYDVIQKHQPQKMKEESSETIQINEVSSSSPDKFSNDEDLDLIPCSRCTRSQDSTNINFISNTNIQKTKITKMQNRKSLRISSSINATITPQLTITANKSIFQSSKNVAAATSSGGNKSTFTNATNYKSKITKMSNRQNSTSPLPRRKTRSTLMKATAVNSTVRKTFGTSKREHPDLELKDLAAADSTRYQGSTTIEPPQKLRRSQSLGPRDFTLRSGMTPHKADRRLRDRNVSLGSLGAIQERNALVNLSAGSSNCYKKLSSIGKNFTPVKQAIQTRNRVKRLNK